MTDAYTEGLNLLAKTVSDQWPDYRVWWTLIYQPQGVSWSALRWDEHFTKPLPTLVSDSPEHLAHAIAEREQKRRAAASGRPLTTP